MLNQSWPIATYKEIENYMLHDSILIFNKYSKTNMKVKIRPKCQSTYVFNKNVPTIKEIEYIFLDDDCIIILNIC